MTRETIAQYEILEELGRGGMGVVYKARDTKLDRFVALKFLPPYLTQDLSARNRFVREARAAAAIEHNHICTIHDIAETEDGRTYIVMSYYSGMALNERIEQGPISVEDAMRIAHQTASALAAAHAGGITHRDIKPGNLILTESGDVKLVDFGLAKLAGQVDLTKSRSTVGTAAYMSPEQIRGEPVDHRSDLWSLGVVFYEMIAGKRPFQGEYEQALSYAILNVDPPPLDAVESVPKGVESIIVDQLLQKDPNNRAGSAGEIAESLKTLCQASSLKETSGLAMQSTAKGSIKPVYRLAALIALIVLVAIWQVNKTPSSEPQLAETETGITRVAILPFSLRGSPEYASLGEGMVDLLSTKIDGAGTWHSVDPRRVLAAVDIDDVNNLDPDAASRYASQLSASLFVLGNIVEIGGRLRVDAAIYQTSDHSEPIGTGTVEGEANSLFDLVDGLASQLLLNPTDTSSERIRKLAELTTTSLDALKAYLDGETAFRALDFMTALNALRRAVEIDDSFALAWYRLSVVADWVSWHETAMEGAENAVKYGQNVPDRDKQLFEAMLASRSGDIENSQRLYNDILVRDPNDAEALFNLAELLYHDAPLQGQTFDAALVMWERMLVQEPNSILALVHLARIAINQGDSDRAKPLVERVLEMTTLGDRNPEFLGYRAMITNRVSDVEEMLSALKESDTSSLFVTAYAFIAQGMGQPELMRILDIMTDPIRFDESRVWGHLWKSRLYLASGQIENALQEIRLAEAFDPHMSTVFKALMYFHPIMRADSDDFEQLQREVEDWKAHEAKSSLVPSVQFSIHNGLYPFIRIYFLGRLAAELGDTNEALTRAAELDEAATRTKLNYPVLENLASSIRARTVVRRDETMLAALERANPRAWFQLHTSPIYGGANDKYERMRLLQELGRHEEVLILHRSLEHSTAANFAYYVPGLVVQARSLIALNRPEEARQSLERFLVLWEHADPELEPMKEEARALLVGLG